MNTRISQLLDQEVSRKEFLTMSGLAVASLFGFGTAIKLLTGKSLHNTVGNAGPLPNLSYSTGAYGGFKKG